MACWLHSRLMRFKKKTPVACLWHGVDDTKPNHVSLILILTSSVSQWCFFLTRQHLEDKNSVSKKTHTNVSLHMPLSRNTMHAINIRIICLDDAVHFKGQICLACFTMILWTLRLLNETGFVLVLELPLSYICLWKSCQCYSRKSIVNSFTNHCLCVNVLLSICM